MFKLVVVGEIENHYLGFLVIQLHLVFICPVGDPVHIVLGLDVVGIHKELVYPNIRSDMIIKIIRSVSYTHLTLPTKA